MFSKYRSPSSHNPWFVLIVDQDDMPLWIEFQKKVIVADNSFYFLSKHRTAHLFGSFLSFDRSGDETHIVPSIIRFRFQHPNSSLFGNRWSIHKINRIGGGVLHQATKESRGQGGNIRFCNFTSHFNRHFFYSRKVELT